MYSTQYQEVAMLALRLPEDIERRLEALAQRTGRSKSFYAREAIVEHMDDLEDAYLASERHKTDTGERKALDDMLARYADDVQKAK
jgi:RHH-type rel operon transcriptional repressor/antitoxin RelB